MTIMQTIDGSHIKRAGHDDDNRLLILEFGSGIYVYDDVPRETFEALLACESKGKYFHGNIRNAFKATRIPMPAERHAAERALTESYNELAAATQG
jgi:KTSC domain